jgi:hypothetical protein
MSDPAIGSHQQPTNADQNSGDQQAKPIARARQYKVRENRLAGRHPLPSAPRGKCRHEGNEVATINRPVPVQVRGVIGRSIPE